MTPHIPTYLRAILSVIQNDLSPLLTSAYASHRIDLVQMVLLRLIADAEGASTDEYSSELVQQLNQIAGELNSAPAPLANILKTIRGEQGSLPADSRLQTRLASALAATQATNAAEKAVVRAVVRAIATAESRPRGEIEAKIVATKATIADLKTSSQELVISEEVFTQYLRRRFPDKPDIRAANLTPLPGGRSKGTILFDLTSGGRTQSMVIRKDFAQDFMQCSVVDEFPLVRAAWKAGLPIPEPYWLEEDASIIDGKFIVFARVAGKAAGTMFEMKTTPAVARQAAAALAKLHAIDINAEGLADALDFGRSTFAVRDMVLSSYEKHRANTAENLLLESAHVWLLNNLDCIDPRPVFVHGDCGFHNVLADGDRMTALLDWELSHAGDPAEDLTSCKTLVETIMPWQAFLDAYVEAGGKPVSAQRQHFFTVWKLVYYITFADAARRMFESGADPDLRLAAIGYNTHRRLQNNLARALALAPP